MQRRFLRVVGLQFTQRRFCKKQNVRVRFAPSPTGMMHIGGLRTALYNYLFARKHGGTFVLRNEDTDRDRYVPGAFESIRDDLIWVGIIPDEDPIRGGPLGPYSQSQRLDLYKEQLQILLDNGYAYHCFCNKRKDETGSSLKYNNRCRYLTPQDIERKRQKGMKSCIRFKLDSTEPFHDLVYGKLSIDVTKAEGDPVIVKEDGYPTYHFANVVDDHFMQISHVLRGSEWLVSTPKHLMLYKALGWTPPQFAHLPLVQNEDNTKLSKRQNDISVDYFRKNGIFPLALLNYITYTGGGFDRDHSVMCCYSYKDLISQFDLTRINTNRAELRKEKLLEYNQLEIINLLENEKNHKLFIETVKEMVKKKFPQRVDDGTLNLDDNYILSILMWSKKRIFKLSDLVSTQLAFLWITPNTQDDEIKHRELIEMLQNHLSNSDLDSFDKQSLNTFLREFAKNNGVSYPELMKSLRRLLSGLKEGPGVSEMMEVLGRDRTIDRLKQFNRR